MENNVAMATDGRKKKCSGISEYSGAYMIVNGVIVCASGAAVVRASRKERRSSREMEKRLRSYSAKSVPEWFRNGQALGAKKLRICPNAARGGLYTYCTYPFRMRGKQSLHASRGTGAVWLCFKKGKFCMVDREGCRSGE